MVVAYYQILLAVSVILTTLYFLSWHKHFDVHVTLIFLLIPVAILGNVLTARATALEEAIAANKITYLGGTYLILMITLSILNLCEITLPRMVRFAMFLASTLVYFGALTVGDRTWFYRSYAFVRDNGAGRLVDKVYGPLHTVYVGLVMLYFAIGLTALVYSYLRKKSVPNKIILLLFIPETVAIADVYDALVSKRVYKESMSFEKADGIIMGGMGTQFDPQLERYYLAAKPRLEKYYSEQEAVADGSGFVGGEMCKLH